MPPSDSERHMAPFAVRGPVRLAPFALVALLLAACTDRAERLALAPEVTFRTLDGERLALHDARGPTLVSFWSTSCGVCLDEMPDLAELHADYAPRGFELVAVAMPHDRPDHVLELAERRALPFPVALDIDGEVLAAFEPVPGTPTSFLIDAEGRIVDKHSGRADLAALRRRLDELLGGVHGSAAGAAFGVPPPVAGVLAPPAADAPDACLTAFAVPLGGATPSGSSPSARAVRTATAIGRFG